MATAGRVAQTLSDLLEERAPYKRSGYPRAGAFDRLAMLALWNVGTAQLAGRYWLPGPRCVLTKEFQLPGQIERLLLGNAKQSVNTLVLVGFRQAPGSMKYGPQSRAFAQLEQGIFLQALHLALCQREIPNHLQGGTDLAALPLRLPWDVEAWAGMAA
jgi:hypothetical protein